MTTSLAQKWNSKPYHFAGIYIGSTVIKQGIYIVSPYIDIDRGERERGKRRKQ